MRYAKNSRDSGRNGNTSRRVSTISREARNELLGDNHRQRSHPGIQGLRGARRSPPGRVSSGDTASDGQSVQEALGEDIKGFCAAIAGEEGAKNYRDTWREQLNRNVARKLSRLGA
ncbi:DUF1048 domain-containing protein [Nocardia sp. N2S4-5]|uniref:DUF1048 domain-containing protein n=1 Tax=Nocardia sp. N2S4-5 TaxID=3351565 RepID=UPI0037D2F284